MQGNCDIVHCSVKVACVICPAAGDGNKTVKNIKYKVDIENRRMCSQRPYLRD